MKENARYFINTYKNHKKAIFNPYNWEKYDTFIFDFSTQKKIVVNENSRNYRILDISYDGCFALTCQNSSLIKGRKFRMVEIDTGKILFEIDDFYIYEAKFSVMPDILLCRANIKGHSRLFVYNLSDNDIPYYFPKDNPISAGCFNYDNNLFIMPRHGRKSLAYKFNFNSLTCGEIQFKDSNFIKDILHYEDDIYVIIDSMFTCVCYKQGVSKWITNIESDAQNNILTFHMMNGCKSVLVDRTPAKSKSQEDIFKDKITMIDMKFGKIDYIKLQKNEYIGKLYPFYDSTVIDAYGRIFDVKTCLISQFPMEKYS